YRALLFAEPQILISWTAGGHRPQISGDTSMLVPKDQPQRILAFGTWLAAEPALQLDHAVDALREIGEGFMMHLITSHGHANEAISRHLELLASSDRAEVQRALAAASQFDGRLPIVTGGERRLYDVRAFTLNDGCAGIAVDASEADNLSAALRRMAEAHRRTL